MNLVDGVTTFPVPVGNDASLARSEDTARRMEAVGQGNLAVVLARNLAITRGLRAVDALLLVLRIREVPLGARGPGNQRKHLEYIAGSG